MSRPSPRLVLRAQRDFPAKYVEEALIALSGIPESLPLADKQDVERL